VHQLRSVAYSVEQVLLNKRQIYGGTPKLDCYHRLPPGLYNVLYFFGNRTTRWQTNLRSVKSWTG